MYKDFRKDRLAFLELQWRDVGIAPVWTAEYKVKEGTGLSVQRTSLFRRFAPAFGLFFPTVLVARSGVKNGLGLLYSDMSDISGDPGALWPRGVFEISCAL